MFVIRVTHKFLQSQQKFSVEVRDNLTVPQIKEKILDESRKPLGMFAGPRENFIFTAGSRSMDSLTVNELKEFALSNTIIATQVTDVESFSPPKSKGKALIYLNIPQLGIVSLSGKYKISREDVNSLDSGYPLRIGTNILLVPEVDNDYIRVSITCNSTYMDFFIEKDEIVRGLDNLFV